MFEVEEYFEVNYINKLIKEHPLKVIVVLIAIICLLIVGIFILNKKDSNLSINTSTDNALVENGTDSISLKEQTLQGNQKIHVDLSGAVNKPGVYEMSQSDIVSNLLAKGEGFSNDASFEWISKKLNMSAILQPNSKLYIPFSWEVTELTNSSELLSIDELLAEEDQYLKSLESNTYNQNIENLNSFYVVSNQANLQNSPNTQTNTNETNSLESQPLTSSETLINVNTASLNEITTLSGVGEVNGLKIINNRPYSNLEEFTTKSTLSENLVNKIALDITF